MKRQAKHNLFLFWCLTTAGLGLILFGFLIFVFFKKPVPSIPAAASKDPLSSSTNSDILLDSALRQCLQAGCSNQLCLPAQHSLGPAFSTCEWRPEYDCYKNAVCELQPTGECGFTLTPELQNCLANARLSTPSMLEFLDNSNSTPANHVSNPQP